MGMQAASVSTATGAEPLMDLNTTPLIDVMLVLLVMLIITIPVQLHSVNLSLGGAASDRTPVVHRVGVDFDGALTWDGQALAGTAALEDRLRAVGARPVAEQPQVQIEPNPLVDYGRVAQVMAAAQRHHVLNMGVVATDTRTRAAGRAG